MTDLETTLKVAEIGSIVASAIVLFFKLGRATERFELIGKQQAKEISELKNNFEKFGGILIEMALQKERMDNQGVRFNLIEQRLHEMAHGRGFVVNREFNSSGG